MESYRYSELYYASTEKNMVSGMPGLGVRTCTKGLGANAIFVLSESCVTGYPVYGARVLKTQQILENPRIVYDYAPMYGYMIVDLNNGEKKYVFSRTVYIGIDYGFFNESGRDDRDGTNYFTHLLVFDDAPSIAFFTRLISGSLFVPKDYTCIPSNPELKGLLTGDPSPLEAKTVTFGDPYEVEVSDLPHAGDVICGIVRMLKNRRMKNKGDIPTKAIIKCDSKLTPRYLELFSLLPQDTIGDIRFQTNYARGYEAPKEYDIVFVDEYNTIDLYENSHVTVDLLSSPRKNFTSDYFLDKIDLWIRQGDCRMAAKLIAFYLDLDAMSDEESEVYYTVFLGAVSDSEIKLEDMADPVIRKLSGLQLDEAQESKLWTKINKALNDGLTATQGSTFLLAVDKIGQLEAHCPGKVVILDECVNYLTGILFSGRGNFGKIANERNITTLLKMVNKDQILTERLFLSSLGETSVGKVWEECLTYHYGGQYENPESILQAIFDSKLPDVAVGDLLSKFFPIPKYAATLFGHFKNHPSDVTRAQGTLSSLVKYYREEHFADFVWLGQLEPKVLDTAGPIISAHYREKVETDVKNGVSATVDFLEQVGFEHFSALNLWPVLKTAARKYLQEPLNEIQAFLSKMDESGVTGQGCLDDELKPLTSLADHGIPDPVTAPYLEAALRAYPGDDRYIGDLFYVWVRNGARADDIKAFVSRKSADLGDPVIEGLVKTVWSCPTIPAGKEKEGKLLAILDNCGWNQKKVNEFIAHCGDSALGAFLQKSSNPFGKIIRKLFK